ncbi:MAG: transporter substrate-binding domain-containing protein [Candidatus Thiodiazotropha sp. (ex Dulcina madagascariensis)]|nr:transporter substrate-binding domain-containing protein [Candidatus Thiodiazotropha sp. (ex Dulcina madagascariensis)]
MTERSLTNGAGAIILLAAGILFSMAIVAQTATEKEQLVAVAPENFPPHYLLDSNGQPTGYAIDTLARLADLAGFQVRYVVMPDWASTMEALRRGEADLIPNLGITPDRSNHFDFTAPLETIALGLFVRTFNTDIHNVNDLAGKTVAVVKRNAAVKWIKSHPQLKARRFDHQEQALFALLSGEVEAMVYPITVTWKMSAAIGVDARIRQAGLPLLEIKRAVAVRKGNRDLLNRLDQAVRQYTGSEHFRNTYTRWHARSQPFWTLERVLQYGGVVAAILLLLTVIIMLWWRYRSILNLNRQLQTSLSEHERAVAEIHKLKEQLELVNRRPVQTDSGAGRGVTNSL